MKNGVKTVKYLYIVLVLIGLALIVSGSYAIWSYNRTGGTNTINSTEIKLEFLESTGEIINITNALPMTDAEGILESEVFDFAVITKTTQNTSIGYTLKMQKLSADTGYTLLNDSDIKIYLEDFEGNALLSPTLVSGLSNYVLYTGTHAHSISNETVKDKFRLRAWIDSSKESEAASWTAATKLQYKFKLAVEAS